MFDPDDILGRSLKVLDGEPGTARMSSIWSPTVDLLYGCYGSSSLSFDEKCGVSLPLLTLKVLDLILIWLDS